MGELRSPRLAPVRHLKGLVGATLGAAALALTGGAYAGGLFLPVGTADAVPRSIEMGADVRERRVRIARRELSAVRDDVEGGGAGRLVLNVADGAHLDVVVERTVPTKWGYSLSGRVAGGGVGFVTLVVHDEAVAGSIWTPEAEYELSSLGGGIHALRDVTNAPRFECSGGLPSELGTNGATQQNGTDDGSVVDILVVWTPEAEEEWGGAPQVLSRIELLIAYTNDAFERSGAFVTLNLVGAEKVDYAEADQGTNIRRLRNPDDGYMDGVHDRRDALGADLVNLLTGGGGGKAIQPGAFTVGEGHPQIFAHEVGHNMGLAHERSEHVNRPELGSFSHGFTTEHCVATIMSYAQGCGPYSYGVYSRPGLHLLPFYASPWRYAPVDGVPLGVTRFTEEAGARGPADAVLVLNRNRHRVANIRPSRGGEQASSMRGLVHRVHMRDSAPAVGSVAATRADARSANEAADLEAPINIPDAVLRSLVEAQLSKEPAEPITHGEIATVEHLSNRGWRPKNAWEEWPRERGVRDLTGIEYAVNLRRLELSGAIWDLSPLAGLTSLTTLRLSYNDIEDVSPLASLSSLTVLHLGANRIADTTPLVGLASLKSLSLGGNRISDVAPLVENRGLGRGDYVDLAVNPLSWGSLETHIPMLLDRGVEVRFDALPELPEIPDVGLREAVHAAIRARREKADLSTLYTIDGAGRGIEELTGLEGASELRQLFLDRNKITDISPLAGFTFWMLTLSHNEVEDWETLASIDLYNVVLDGNSLRELPLLPNTLRSLSFADNEISDIEYLANQLSILSVLRMDGNSITSLEPLAGMRGMEYLHMNDNQVVDLSPLNLAPPSYAPMLELHMRNNAVRDITPLLNGEGLLMVDVRRNPLADDALAVLETLRERHALRRGLPVGRVTVLAGETVPYFPAAGGDREGFVRIVNRSNRNGHVFIEAVDDAGVRAGPVRLNVRARRAIHFDSADLEHGKAAMRLEGIGPPTAGDWRLSVISALDIEVLSYIRTEDGFLTAMHDVVPDAMAPFFNPGDARQRSVLRTVNMEAEPAKWTTGGYDDRGRWRPMTGSMLVRPQHALTLTGEALEDVHGLGDGDGRWRLRVRGFPWFAMSLLENPTGHLTNLSTAPDNATLLADGRTMHRLPLFPVADGSREGVVRVINRSYSSGEVTIEAVDDAGARSGPVHVAVAPRRAVELSATDLEHGNVEKGLAGHLGVGEGDWRLEVASELELMALSYVQTADGFLGSLHDVAPVAEDGGHRVVFFKPGSNRWQVSKLRLVNDGERLASVRVAGIDDRGVDSGTVTLTVPAGSALTFTSAELETGSERLAGSLGDGYGQWRLRVHSDEPIAVMSLLETPGGLLANMSTGTAD